MSYKPKYCCQCGEKVERTTWRLWTNRRFCELCETDYGLSDNIQKAAFVILFLTSIFGIGNLWRQPERQLVVASKQSTSGLADATKSSAVQTNTAQNINSATAQTIIPNTESKIGTPEQQPAAGLKQNEIAKQFETQKPVAAQEKIYFCGAQTKKGTPCTRRVKNGGRCWQHIGQPAMLPQEKLLASR